MLSSKEILKTTNVGSPKTLTRWHQRGLIPPPEIRTHPSGRGKMAYWQPWVVYRIKEVKDRLRRGETLDEIAGSESMNWEEEERRWTHKRRDVKKAEENARRGKAIEMFSEAAAARVYDFLTAIGVQRPGIFNRLERQFSEVELVKKAVKFCQAGFNTFAVIVGEEIHVTADFMLGSSVDANSKVILAVPIGDLIRSAFGNVSENLSPSSTLVVAHLVQCSEGGQAIVRKVLPRRNWSFELVADKEPLR